MYLEVCGCWLLVEAWYAFCLRFSSVYSHSNYFSGLWESWIFKVSYERFDFGEQILVVCHFIVSRPDL